VEQAFSFLKKLINELRAFPFSVVANFSRLLKAANQTEIFKQSVDGVV
jgi:hypothetical protein